VRRIDPKVDGQVGDALVGASHPVRFIFNLFSEKNRKSCHEKTVRAAKNRLGSCDKNGKICVQNETVSSPDSWLGNFEE
jgi:hypothetical protein